MNKDLHSQYYPDHQGSSLFVKKYWEPRDVIIAQDSLIHYAYFFRVDYEITLEFKGRAEGWLNAKSIRSADELFQIIKKNKNTRIWLILSGHKINKTKIYRSMHYDYQVMLSFFDLLKRVNAEKNIGGETVFQMTI